MNLACKVFWNDIRYVFKITPRLWGFFTLHISLYPTQIDCPSFTQKYLTTQSVDYYKCVCLFNWCWVWFCASHRLANILKLIKLNKIEFTGLGSLVILTKTLNNKWEEHGSGEIPRRENKGSDLLWVFNPHLAIGFPCELESAVLCFCFSGYSKRAIAIPGSVAVRVNECPKCALRAPSNTHYAACGNDY